MPHCAILFSFVHAKNCMQPYFIHFHLRRVSFHGFLSELRKLVKVDEISVLRYEIRSKSWNF